MSDKASASSPWLQASPSLLVPSPRRPLPAGLIQRGLLVLALVASSGCEKESPAPATKPAPAQPVAAKRDSAVAHGPRPNELYTRDGDRIVFASAADLAVARGYDGSHEKGEEKDGIRLTLLTARRRVMVGEKVRVIHVLEASGPTDVYIMGPKDVYGEYVDGVPVTPAPPTTDYPWLGIYNGAVIKGPYADFHYNITEYEWSTPGRHQIEWRLGSLQSNRLEMDVMAPDR
jgi:hypothetical protein